MSPIDRSVEVEIRELIYAFFSEECDVDAGELSDDTDVIEDLEGDSLMMLALLQKVCRTYEIEVELKTLGKHLMRKQVNTIGQIISLTNAVVEHGANILNMEI